MSVSVHVCTSENLASIWIKAEIKTHWTMNDCKNLFVIFHSLCWVLKKTIPVAQNA